MGCGEDAKENIRRILYIYIYKRLYVNVYFISYDFSVVKLSKKLKTKHKLEIFSEK